MRVTRCRGAGSSPSRHRKGRSAPTDRAGSVMATTFVCLSPTQARGWTRRRWRGLSMVHGLAEQSEGRLVLKSRKGEGTTAEVWLPVASVQDRTAHQQDASGDAATNGLRLRTLTIVVVDDDSLVLTNTAAMLEDLGHEVIEATSGEQALRVLRRGKRIDLLITDQVMPGMTGTQLIAAIRAEWPHLPVILATGYAELPAETDPDLLRLSKPFLQDDLARAIAARIEAKETDHQVLPFRPRQG